MFFFRLSYLSETKPSQKKYDKDVNVRRNVPILFFSVQVAKKGDSFLPTEGLGWLQRGPDSQMSNAADAGAPQHDAHHPWSLVCFSLHCYARIDIFEVYFNCYHGI